MTMIQIIVAGILLAVIVAASVAVITGARYTRGWNIGEGTWEGILPFRAAGPIGKDWLLAKPGATAGEVALAGAGDKPLGPVIDQSAAAGDLVSVELLETAKRTFLGVAAGAVAKSAGLYTAAEGMVQGEPDVPGTYWLVGRTIGAAAGEYDLVPYVPCAPQKLVVLPAPGNAEGEIAALTFSGTATKAEAEALRDKCEELAGDLRVLAAALSSGALVKVLPVE